MEILQAKYPNINFEISDTQRDLIELSNENMLVALRDAIFYTLLIILFFLGNIQGNYRSSNYNPDGFLFHNGVIWLTGGSLNIVIYTAIILALGMLTDNAVVVLENIERHLNELKEDLQKAINLGTKEVYLSIWSGTIATIAIVFPLMFVGGFHKNISTANLYFNHCVVNFHFSFQLHSFQNCWKLYIKKEPAKQKLNYGLIKYTIKLSAVWLNLM